MWQRRGWDERRCLTVSERIGHPESHAFPRPDSELGLIPIKCRPVLLKHPPSWFVSPEGDNNGLVSVGMGVKHSLGPVQYVTDISAGSWPVAMQMDTSCFKLAAGQSEPETVDGVTGVRKTGTLIACQGGQTLDTVEYDFAIAGRNYLFSYTRLADGVPLADFDMMVRSTTTFSG